MQVLLLYQYTVYYHTSLCCYHRICKPIGIFNGLLLDIFTPEDDLHGSLCSHYCYLGTRPCIIDISSQMFRWLTKYTDILVLYHTPINNYIHCIITFIINDYHDIISSPISFPSYDSQLGNRCLCITIQQLRPMTDDTTVFLTEIYVVKYQQYIPPDRSQEGIQERQRMWWSVY